VDRGSFYQFFKITVFDIFGVVGGLNFMSAFYFAVNLLIYLKVDFLKHS